MENDLTKNGNQVGCVMYFISCSCSCFALALALLLLLLCSCFCFALALLLLLLLLCFALALEIAIASTTASFYFALSNSYIYRNKKYSDVSLTSITIMIFRHPYMIQNLTIISLYKSL